MIRRLIRAIRSSQEGVFAAAARLYLQYRGVRFGPRLVLQGCPIVTRHPQGSIEIGSDVVLCSSNRHAALGVQHPVILRAARPGAQVRIGDGAGITGATILALRSITIGPRTLLGANVTVVDSDFHPLDPARRHDPPGSDSTAVAPVAIGRNVFVGANSIVLKGVTIGDNSVIGAGSVVTKDIPPNVIAAGNPCRVLKPLPGGIAPDAAMS